MIGRILEGYGFLLINLAAPVLLNLHTHGNVRGSGVMNLGAVLCLQETPL